MPAIQFYLKRHTPKFDGKDQFWTLALSAEEALADFERQLGARLMLCGPFARRDFILQLRSARAADAGVPIRTTIDEFDLALLH